MAWKETDANSLGRVAEVIVFDNSPRAPLVRSHAPRTDIVLRTTIFLTSSDTNAAATLVELRPENRFFLLTAQHVVRILEEKQQKWSYQNVCSVVRHLKHPPKRTDLGNERPYSPDLTLLELNNEDVAEMALVGLKFYDLGTIQYTSDEEYGADYFIVGAPKSEEDLVDGELRFEIRCAGVNILDEIVVDGVRRFQQVEAIEGDYSGMSGGGLWEISYPASGGHRIFLSGVVVDDVQMSESTVETPSTVRSAVIRCSTRESIQELVTKARSLSQ